MRSAPRSYKVSEPRQNGIISIGICLRRSAFWHETGSRASLGSKYSALQLVDDLQCGFPMKLVRLPRTYAGSQPLSISLQRQAQTQGPESVVRVGYAGAKSVEAPILAPDATRSATPPLAVGRNRFQFLILIGMLLVGLGFGFALGTYSHRTSAPLQETSEAVNIEAVVEQIINVESSGDPNAKNKRSSAMGLGQFLDETWLVLIRAHRPDLVRGRSEGETLELRRDPIVAREITSRFTERNANILRKRGLPVTPGTLYLAHFAGAAGAIAILSALEGADAASIMASADATGRTKREKLVKANPFLERFTVADLKSWADRKMRIRRS